MEPIYWLIAVGVLIILEMFTMGLTTIWFAGGALVAFIADVSGAPLWIQIVCFLVVSIVLLVFTRPITEKYFNKSRAKTNVDGFVGQQGRVIEEINRYKQTGKVMLNGMEWTAVSNEDDMVIALEEKVEVVKVEGAHLVVTVVK